MTILKARCSYFAAKNDAYASPKGVYKTMETDPDSIFVVDVRNPVGLISSRISGSIWIPENEIEARISELPTDTPIVLYCWDVWCGLASQAAIPLLNAGYDARELHGGVKAWRALRQPMRELTDSIS